jgi:hypothetical protein
VEKLHVGLSEPYMVDVGSQGEWQDPVQSEGLFVGDPVQSLFGKSEDIRSRPTF